MCVVICRQSAEWESCNLCNVVHLSTVIIAGHVVGPGVCALNCEWFRYRDQGRSLARADSSPVLE